MQLASTLFRIAHAVSADVPARSRDKVFLHLLSEIGEIAEEINIHAGELYKTAGPDGVSGEACDIINCLADLAWLRCAGMSPEKRQEAFAKLTNVDGLESMRTTSFAHAKAMFITTVSNLSGLSVMARRETNAHLTPVEIHISTALIRVALTLAVATTPGLTEDDVIEAYSAKCAKWRSKATGA